MSSRKTKTKTKTKKTLPNWDRTNDLTPLKPSISKGKYINHEFNNIKVASVEYTKAVVGTTYIDFKNGARVVEMEYGGCVNKVSTSVACDNNILYGICLSSGSTLGLEATTGAISEKMKQLDYYDFVPISGCIHRGNIKQNMSMFYPDKELGRYAVKNIISNKVLYGQIGGGIGAMYGQGCSYGVFKNKKVLVVLVNNAVGSIHKDGKKFSGKKTYKSTHKNKKSKFNKKTIQKKNKKVTNKSGTFLCVIITDLDLNVQQLELMSKQVNNSIGEYIKPFNTIYDGDMIYTCSTFKKKNKFNKAELIDFYAYCSKLVGDAIFRSTIEKKKFLHL